MKPEEFKVGQRLKMEGQNMVVIAIIDQCVSPPGYINSQLNDKWVTICTNNLNFDGNSWYAARCTVDIKQTRMDKLNRLKCHLK